MATQTENYGLTMPDQNEYYNVEVFNENARKIDAAIKLLAEAIGSMGSMTGYIPETAINAPNGVAGLDSTGLLAASLFPALDYIKTSARDAANGVAPLDAAKKVPIANLYAAVANGLATLGSDGFVPAGQLNLTAAQVAETTERVWMSPDERTKLGSIAQIAAGTFIGDGTTGRTITLPFIPSVVVLHAVHLSISIWQGESTYLYSGNTGKEVANLAAGVLTVNAGYYDFVSGLDESPTFNANAESKNYFWLAIP